MFLTGDLWQPGDLSRLGCMWDMWKEERWLLVICVKTRCYSGSHYMLGARRFSEERRSNLLPSSCGQLSFLQCLKTHQRVAMARVHQLQIWKCISELLGSYWTAALATDLQLVWADWPATSSTRVTEGQGCQKKGLPVYFTTIVDRHGGWDCKK